MKIVLMSIHPMEDDRIKRHILFLTKKNYDVYYLHYNILNNDLEEGRFSAYGEKGFRINNLKPSSIKRKLFLLGNEVFSRTLQALKSLDLSLNDRIILHVHNPECFKISSRLSKQLTDRMVVYDRHEYYERFKGALGFKSLYLLEKIFSKHVDYIINVSDDQESSTRAIFTSSRVAVVPNYPETSLYDKSIIQQKINTFENKRNINFVYVGSFNESIDRDVFLLLNIIESILSHVPNCRFYLAGDIPSEDIKQRISDLQKKFSGHIDYLGYISRQKAIEITEKAHLGFFLIKPDSDYWVKCSPNKVFEYLICGVIPIIRANIEHSDALKDSVVLLDKDHDFKKINEEILELLKDRGHLMALMKKGIDLSKDFIWENVAQQYIEVYNRFI